MIDSDCTCLQGVFLKCLLLLVFLRICCSAHKIAHETRVVASTNPQNQNSVAAPAAAHHPRGLVERPLDLVELLRQRHLDRIQVPQPLLLSRKCKTIRGE